MRPVKIHIFEDPGHGWARFPKHRLVKLGIANDISSYSYQHKGNAFLEEDGDLSILLSALKLKGFEYKIICTHTDKMSKIRNFQHYSVDS
jgi:hypothetical protein